MTQNIKKTVRNMFVTQHIWIDQSCTAIVKCLNLNIKYTLIAACIDVMNINYLTVNVNYTN